MEKRYNFLETEKMMQQFWADEKVYRFDGNAEGEVYSIDTPPPTVSGAMHIGHLFSYTQAEIVARFRRMQGENVFYPFGFDDNGLPTERLVEREEGIKAAEMPRHEFIARCQKTTARYEEEFKEFWQSLGFSVDWDNSYRTISPEVERISQSLFLELVEKGRAYCKDSPVLWCTECKTSIAQAELETADIASSFNYVNFFVNETPIEVATTRPELLYGCVCLFVNAKDERYSHLVGHEASVPLYDYKIPILSDDRVDTEKGTGVVMCATFGDATDLEWYRDYKLPYRKVICLDGKIDDAVPFIGGRNIKAARSEILRILSEKELLVRSQDITHPVNTHERCSTEVEIIPSRQWYIDILSEKERFLDAADKINWYPQSMKKRYVSWVQNLKWDWCISRQRYFGIPFPVWYCNECGKPVYANPQQLPINPMEQKFSGVCECGCGEFTPETAVLDTWATSSITPQINERLGLNLTPMSMRTHAHEIIRTWTFYTIVRSLYHTGTIPWKDLMICGFVLAKKGEKISKSKGNDRYEPKALIKEYSADVLRYWTAGARLGTDSFFSSDDLSVSKRFVTKLYNAARFVVSHLDDFDPMQIPELLPVDIWISERVKSTMSTAQKLLYSYEIGSAKQEIDELFWKDFCDNYIEIVKDRLYKPELHGSAQRKAAQYTIYNVLLSLLKMYAIYVPHITEYIYLDYFKTHEGVKSIHLLGWCKAEEVDGGYIEFGERLKEVVFDVRRYKTENNLSMKSAIDVVKISAGEYKKWFMLCEKDLIACTSTELIEYV